MRLPWHYLESRGFQGFGLTGGQSAAALWRLGPAGVADPALGSSEGAAACERECPVSVR